ncbi:MAG: hypothetical protein COA42_11970 [Alteromonadaceae bacterium]|nr:MAG: hypothetical protein COA42_11970 [Alteromonadaceae bacterium]
MNFEALITLAVSQRPKFKGAIGYAPQVHDISTPPPFLLMYNVVAGTLKSIEDPSVMDVVPGLRLIHRDELAGETARFRETYNKLSTHIPFLADDSSCYVSLDLDDGSVYRVAPEYGTSKLSDSLEAYWETVYECYTAEAFFLDAEGYLDFDFEKEGEVGARINPGCEYWIE